MNELTGWDNEYSVILVVINSMLETVLLALFATLYLRVISRADATMSTVSYKGIATSAVVFLGFL